MASEQNSEFITFHKPDGSPYVVHISQLSADTADSANKNRQIKESEQQAEQQKQKQLDTIFKERAEKTAQNAYSVISKKINADSTFILDAPIEDHEKLVKYAITLANKNKLGMGCYNVAGIIAAIFDSINKSYTCIIGNCNPNSAKVSEYDKNISNHVWIKDSDGIIYENFLHYKNSDLGKHTEKYKIKFKK